MKIAKKIHLVIDRSKNSNKATDQAVMMARKLEADLSSLYVVNTHMYQTPKVIGAMLRTGKKHLKIVKDNALEIGVNITSSRILVGGPTNDILKDVKSNRSDLLIIGAGANSPKGSVPDKLIRKAKCNLLLVRGDQNDGNFNKILVPINNPDLEAPLFAVNLAKQYNAQLTTCHVIDVKAGLTKERVVYLPEASKGSMAHIPHSLLGEKVPLTPALIDKLKNNMTEKGYKITCTVAKTAKEAGIEAKSVILSGRPSVEINKYATEGNFDLIVMNHTNRGRLSRLLTGSVSKKIARNASCSVMIINNAS
ncbi:MAG: universal stress protein [Candidatus Methanomarinus sp.]|uniref:Universal stress protein n=1 Tax=Candidatus Methanomarinus sp. TaxID=3386244 RepID=A0AC61SBL0_9EURY|nr:MAG: universal stress protein [ANME-2 cluster archaeon]